MTHAAASLALDVPAAKVWALIGPFDGLARWHPAVRACVTLREEGTGAVLRRIHLHDGGVIVNRLDAADPARRFYRYTLLAAPLPVAGYTATLSVYERGPGACRIEWSGDFTAKGVAEAEAARLIEAVFRQGLDNFAGIFAAPPMRRRQPLPETRPETGPETRPQTRPEKRAET